MAEKPTVHAIHQLADGGWRYFVHFPGDHAACQCILSPGGSGWDTGHHVYYTTLPDGSGRLQWASGGPESFEVDLTSDEYPPLPGDVDEARAEIDRRLAEEHS